jgi:hypothetical protein
MMLKSNGSLLICNFWQRASVCLAFGNVPGGAGRDLAIMAGAA